MTTILLTIHFIISVALVISVLLQRSEGGALGIGGGGPGGMMSGRAATTMLSRTTGLLGAAFFVMSILLTVVPNWGKGTVESEIVGQQIEAEIIAPVIEKPVEKPEPE